MEERLEYPEGSFGAVKQALAQRVEALPWYLWPYKVALRRQLRAIQRESEQRAADAARMWLR
jgi:hypothetical protein